MKICFLDIDGVLNYCKCTSKAPSGVWGIEDDKLTLLKQIIEATHAKIVLTSTWKTEWFRTEYTEDLSMDGQYLVNKFAQFGLSILDKTYEDTWAKRGEGILSYIKTSKVPIESFVILDDESFDFKTLDLTDKFVKTNISEGLTPSKAQLAIQILNNLETYEGGISNDCQ